MWGVKIKCRERGVRKGGDEQGRLGCRGGLDDCVGRGGRRV